MTYVKKKLEAWGKFVASKLGTEAGFFTRAGKAAMIPDERVTIKKECCNIHVNLQIEKGGIWYVLTTTWKMKYRVIRLSSTPVWRGIPSNFAR